MPLYDYHCSQCSVTFEKRLNMSQNELPVSEPCPECKSEGTITQVLLSAFAIGDPIRLGIKRPDAGWGDVLKKVKAAHPLGNVGKKFSPISGL